jgi:hypothetical protein
VLVLVPGVVLQVRLARTSRQTPGVHRRQHQDGGASKSEFGVRGPLPELRHKRNRDCDTTSDSWRNLTFREAKGKILRMESGVWLKYVRKARSPGSPAA